MLTEKVLEIIAETQRVPRESITVETSFDELGIDSLDALNILFGIETAYDVDIAIPNDKLLNMRNVNELIELLQEHVPKETLERVAAGGGKES